MTDEPQSSSRSPPTVCVGSSPTRSVALGVPPGDAASVAEVLVEADLTGVDSHGVHLLLMYADRLRSGQILPMAGVEVLDDSGSTVWLDAGLGMGQIAGRRAVDLAGRARARPRRGHRRGPRGDPPRRPRRLHPAGRRARAWSASACRTGRPSCRPTAGVTPMFSTNPFSYAIPTGRHPTVVFDIATTAVAGNRLLLAKRRGDPSIPEGWASDEQGRPTTDTDAASVWNLQWFGGHKGYGLGLLVEVLAGVLAGSSYGRTEHTASDVHGRGRVAKGFTFVGIDPERFVGLDELAAAHRRAHRRRVRLRAGGRHRPHRGAGHARGRATSAAAGATASRCRRTWSTRSTRLAAELGTATLR